MKSSENRFILIVAVLALVNAAPAAETSGRSSVSFDERGVIVDIHTFFRVATRDRETMPVVAHGSVAGKALVTEDGVYGFLETPENEKLLAAADYGSVVQAKGKLLREGALLHLVSLELKTQVPLIDFARFRDDEGLEVELAGVNKCQCGLDVGDLPHSCKLGHLHHLEAGDGRLYHYLQFARGKDFFLGTDSHFKPVAVKARLLPGNYLLVSAAEVGK